MTEGRNGVTILPEQVRRLLAEVEQTNAAIGVTQDGGSVLRINTGTSIFDIDAHGNNTENP